MVSLRAGLRAAALSVVLVAGWYYFTYADLPERASTVSLLHARDMFDQCSRPTPEQGEPYWVPTARQIRAIEPHLWALGRQATSNLPDIDQRFTHQYLGFTQGTRRLIYVSVVVDDWLSMKHTNNELFQHVVEGLLPEKPFVICDGGAFSWGVVYEPSTAKFESLSFSFH